MRRASAARSFAGGLAVLAGTFAASAAVGLAAPPPAPSAPSQADPYIVGGGPAAPRGWRFAAALRQKGFGYFCSGALIAPDRVLTAAHCVKAAKVRKMRVLVGSPYSRGKRAADPIRVRRARVHPRYNGKKDRRDLAVITLRRPVDVAPAVLATARQVKAATKRREVVRTAGWGAASPWGFRLPSRLKAVRERVFPNRFCRRLYGKNAYDPRTMFCALGPRIPRRRTRSILPFFATSCSGDSGGPSMAMTAEGPRLIGVVSVGPLPCGLAAPSIYARVSSGLGFIRRAAGLAPEP